MGEVLLVIMLVELVRLSLGVGCISEALCTFQSSKSVNDFKY